MKKIALIAALALVAGATFAQAPGGEPGRGPGMGAGNGLGVEWKIGTVVTTEYKKVTGTLVLGQTLTTAPTFKVDGTDYQLWLPRNLSELSSVKNGDTLTVEGTFTTVKSDTKVPPVAHAFKVTVNGKEIDLTAMAPGRGSMMRGGDDQNGTFGQGPGKDNGRRK